MTDDTRDVIARLRAQIDQAREAVKEIAVLMVAYYNALIEAGMPEPAALALTTSYQQTLVLLGMQSNQAESGDGQDS